MSEWSTHRYWSEPYSGAACSPFSLRGLSLVGATLGWQALQAGARGARSKLVSQPQIRRCSVKASMRTITIGAITISVAVMIVVGCNTMFNLPATTGQANDACGGTTGVTCGTGLYCMYETGQCNETDTIAGTCQEIPTTCAQWYDPVCGCDGEDYANECSAAAASVNIETNGPCTGNHDICGGIQGLQCSDGYFCLFETAACGAGDATGVCIETPDVCSQEVVPVCGCDGVEYSNECEAWMAGTSVNNVGECEEEEEQICGGLLGLLCSDGEYCMYDIGLCGDDTSTGICEEIPEECSDVYDPVCGCNGLTYSNACEAAADGININTNGTCLELPE